MKNKNIIYNDEARNGLLAGVNALYKSVAVTLGPCGRNVIIEKDDFPGKAHSTKDGVSVANSIFLKDPIENLGAQLVKEVASQTADVAGDGTTTATILAQSIISEGLKQVSNGANPMDLKRGIDSAVKQVLTTLKANSKDISSELEVEQVGTISANNDSEVGKLLSQAMDKVGTDGVIAVEEGKTSETTLETVEGVQFDRGYISPYFVTNNESMSSKMDDAYVLIYDKKISNVKQIVKVMEQCIAKNKPLLVIAEDIDGEALAAMVVNKARSIIKCCAVKAPDFGERRKSLLEDIAIITGGIVISPDKGMKLENVTLESLGRARTITVTNKQTTIVDGKGDETKIVERIEEIKAQIDQCTSDYDTERFQQRLAKLTGGVAIISIGANSELELKEKKDRVEDALHATRAAVEEGIVPGGGLALLNAVKDTVFVKGDNDDQNIGIEIVKRACRAPFNIIMKNAGLNPDIILRDIQEKNDPAYGYNARTDEVVNMFEAGIIDPTKVTRTALEKAASVASLFLTTECCISLDRDEKEDEMGQQMY